MPRFEILIPKSAKLPMDMRLRLQAESWVDALRTGLAKVGEDGAAAENILCDIKEDNSIHVTDTSSGRVFRILELQEEDAAAAPRPDQPVAAPAVTAPAPKPAPPAPQVQPAPPAPARVAAAPAPVIAPPAAAPVAPPRAVDPEPALPPAVAPPAPPEPGLRITATASGIGRAIDFTSEATADFLEEIFAFTDGVNQQPSVTDALYFMLDLAIDKIGTDAGSILLADINSDELKFSAVRGPKADQVLTFKVKVGQGIVGFCVDAGIGMALSEAARDKRFYADISEKIGYPTRSVLCAPMKADGQVVGAIELINKSKNDTFSERDLGVISFIGQQLARFIIQRRQ